MTKLQRKKLKHLKELHRKAVDLSNWGYGEWPAKLWEAIQEPLIEQAEKAVAEIIHEAIESFVNSPNLATRFDLKDGELVVGFDTGAESYVYLPVKNIDISKEAAAALGEKLAALR